MKQTSCLLHGTTILLLSLTVTAAYPKAMTQEAYTMAGHTAIAPDTLATDTAQDHTKVGFVKKVINYFRDSNKQKEEKKIDFGILPGPHYSSTTGLGLGVIGTATYTTGHPGTPQTRSNASVYIDMTTGGYFTVGLKGNHFFPHDRFRLDYKLNLSTFTTSFWGIGYELADNDDNKTDYRRNRVNALARFMARLAANTYLGPLVNYRFYEARGVDEAKKRLWQGQDLSLGTYTVGLSFTYDSRDFMLNASKGVFLQIDQTFSPRFLGNGDHSFSTTEAVFSAYRRVWKGGILAGELHGQLNYGHTPWPLLSETGSNDRMRGYYEGRYRDKNLVEGQLELRQHIKGRHGMAVWAGLANVFNDFDHIAMRHTLPNAGIGYRWEFKKGINVRIDYGFTRNGGGFIFNVNEAF